MLLRIFALMLFSLTAVACGGGGGGGDGQAPAAPAPSGGGGGTPPPPPPTPSPGTDVIRGVITGFGSVFIDGTRFNTDDATFSKDDDEVTQDDLSVGMVVELQGDLDARTATMVKFEEDIKGPVDAVSADELTVMGQTVVITPQTIFDDNLDPATINVGDVLEVSGLRGVADVLEASFIEDKTGDAINAYKVIGQVRDHDGTGQTFRIGDLVVDYSIAELDDIAAPGDGMTVEVKDSNLAYNPGDLTLLATKVEPAGLGEGGLPDDDDDNGGNDDGDDRDDDDREYQVEGLITAIVDDMTFELAGIVVHHDANTEFEYGDVTRLAVGTRVEVEGTPGENGSINAREIEFSDNGAGVDGIIELTNMDDNTLVVFGVTVEVRPGAELEDDDGSISFADLSVGDFVEVEGIETGDRVFASEVERDEADDTSLRGAAQDVDADNRSLSILGIAIVTSANTQYEGFNDEPMTAEAFFAALFDGQTLVEAEWEGTVTDPTVAVHELSLED